MNEVRQFRADPAAAGRARRFVIDLLADQSRDVIEAAELMVSELVTNVIRHAPGPFTVRVMTDEDKLRIEVTDRGEGWPQRRNPGAGEPTGRGLQIVQALSAQWQVTPVEPTGKTVAFVLALA